MRTAFGPAHMLLLLHPPVYQLVDSRLHQRCRYAMAFAIFPAVVDQASLVCDQVGVIAEFVPKRTLSSIEERGAGISQRPKPILERFGRPDVVAIKTDVFPAERSDVGQQRVGQNFALDAKLGDGAAEIDGVPEGDGGDREVETRGPVALIFEGAVRISP